MRTTSIAHHMNDFGYDWSVFTPLPTAPNAPAAVTAKRQSIATPFSTAAEHRANGANRDGQLGGFILDAFFNVAFPGFGAVFGPLGMLDMADALDETRSAFARASRPSVRSPFMASNAQRRPGAPVPGMMRRRKPGLFSFMFG